MGRQRMGWPRSTRQGRQTASVGGGEHCPEADLRCPSRWGPHAKQYYANEMPVYELLGGT